MPFISITRLRIRSIRFMPRFALHTSRSFRQASKAPGFQDGAVLADRRWTFWTMTAWDDRASMRRYMTTGSHRTAMPLLMQWCDEASFVHWDQPDHALPSWSEADRQMRENGRVSKVNNPSPNHAALTYQAPRTTVGGPIRPA